MPGYFGCELGSLDGSVYDDVRKEVELRKWPTEPAVYGTFSVLCFAFFSLSRHSCSFRRNRSVEVPTHPEQLDAVFEYSFSRLSPHRHALLTYTLIT